MRKRATAAAARRLEQCEVQWVSKSAVAYCAAYLAPTASKFTKREAFWHALDRVLAEHKELKELKEARVFIETHWPKKPQPKPGDTVKHDVSAQYATILRSTEDEECWVVRVMPHGRFATWPKEVTSLVTD